jgi:hypothetical protein
MEGDARHATLFAAHNVGARHPFLSSWIGGVGRYTNIPVGDSRTSSSRHHRRRGRRLYKCAVDPNEAPARVGPDPDPVPDPEMEFRWCLRTLRVSGTPVSSASPTRARPSRHLPRARVPFETLFGDTLHRSIPTGQQCFGWYVLLATRVPGTQYTPHRNAPSPAGAPARQGRCGSERRSNPDQSRSRDGLTSSTAPKLTRHVDSNRLEAPQRRCDGCMGGLPACPSRAHRTEAQSGCETALKPAGPPNKCDALCPLRWMVSVFSVVKNDPSITTDRCKAPPSSKHDPRLRRCDVFVKPFESSRLRGCDGAIATPARAPALQRRLALHGWLVTAMMVIWPCSGP